MQCQRSRQLAAGQVPVLAAVAHSPVAVSAVVRLTLQSETAIKVLPEVA